MRLRPIFMLGAILLCLFGEVSLHAATAARSVAGEILEIHGEVYIVKDKAGQQIVLHVDDKTARLDQAVLQVGDPILAYVTPEGHATSIKNLGPADQIEHNDARKPGVTPPQ